MLSTSKKRIRLMKTASITALTVGLMYPRIEFTS